MNSEIINGIIKEIIGRLDSDIFEYQDRALMSSCYAEAYGRFKSSLSELLKSELERIPDLSAKSCKISADEKDLDNPESFIFYGIDLSDKDLTSINFDDRILVNVSFKKSRLVNCRFRNACVLFCDMRYADFNGGTFEKAQIWWCDLYRSFFQGVIRFANATITACSINNAYFSGATLIRKTNFKDRRILQMNPQQYGDFLYVWDAIRSSSDKIRNNNHLTGEGEAKIRQIVERRHEELELIFKTLSSTFSAIGFSDDSNWAYVMGEKAERRVLWNKLSIKKLFSRECFSQIRTFGKWLMNLVFDAAFGYGESMTKIFITYMVIVVVFTFIYSYHCDMQNFLEAFMISFKNMVGSSDELAAENNIILNFLNVLQTTLGILITGIFGFILGNKIRNQ